MTGISLGIIISVIGRHLINIMNMINMIIIIIFHYKEFSGRCLVLCVLFMASKAIILAENYLSLSGYDEREGRWCTWSRRVRSVT